MGKHTTEHCNNHNRLRILLLLILLYIPLLCCHSPKGKVDINQIAFERQESDSYSFQWPSTWQIRKQSTDTDEGFIIDPPGFDERTNILVVSRRNRLSVLKEMYPQWLLERMTIEPSNSVSVNDQTTSAVVDGHEAISLRWKQGGSEADNMTILTKLPKGEFLEITLSVFGKDKLEELEPIYRRIVESTQFKQ